MHKDYMFEIKSKMEQDHNNSGSQF